MSKSSWIELPDATKPEAYVFMEKVCREAWAWEFLRRIPEYRAEYDAYGGGKQARVFMPPMKPEDMNSERRWIYRILEDGGEPRVIHVNQYASEKWGLKRLVPHDQPYGKSVQFVPSVSMYPMLVRHDEDLIRFFEEIGGHDGTPIVNAVLPDKAIFVFDLGASRSAQIKALKTALDRVYEERRLLEGIKRTSLPKKETEYLVRHLRVLDLFRVSPDISCGDIALALGYDETLTGKSASQQGARWKEQALSAQKNYRSFLKNASTIENS